MLDYGFYNMDCMEGMKDFPDNYFDLAVVDPPYGAGFTEGGGCKGWFSKYHQAPESGGVLQQVRRQVRQVQAERITPSESESAGRVTRTGGTWAEKYAKKSYRGIQPPEGNILTNSFVSHVTRLSGGATTLICRLHAAF
jgi:hypothetical protein